MYDILRQNPQVWELFTRKEEYTNPFRDQYGRFPYYASKNRDIFEPLASRYLIEHDYHIEYPDNAPFAVCLTHDIDTIYRSLAKKGLMALQSLKYGNHFGTFRTLPMIRSRKLPLCNFQQTMDLEEGYGAKSTFFFMAEHPDEQDYAYNIEDLKIEIRNIINCGWEVGLHGGHTTYLDPNEMRQKKERLEKVTQTPVIGFRNHFLRFRVPDTWEYLSQAGFQYDTTFGYADCVGFRNGMCHPFRPFNLNTGCDIDIVEIPLVVMDGTLDETYMRIDVTRKWEFVKELIDRVAECHGVFTLLWHNTYLEGENLALYEKMLRFFNKKKAWITSGGRLASHINKNCKRW